MVHRYQYTPLDTYKPEIRLLLLHPSEKFSPQIQCSMFTTTIKDAPNYIALSYCWGRSSNPLFIRLDDAGPFSQSRAYMPITVNLYMALRRLRQKNNALILWADAICINQEDIPERNRQVTLMRDIYEHAEGTVVWLGEAANHSGLALGLIRAWADAEKDLEAFIGRCSFAFKLQMWIAVRKLASRPWWTRMWIYQEYTVSNQVHFLCGPDSISHQDFRRARLSWDAFRISTAQSLVGAPQRVMVMGFQPVHITELEYQRVAVEVRRQRLQRGVSYEDIPRLDLLALINLTRGAVATDARDKIYALLGVDEVKDIEVIPNYSDSITKVYTDFAFKYLLVRPDLTILCEAGIGYGAQDPSLPSWVPDLRTVSSKGQNLTNPVHCAGGIRQNSPKVDSKHSLLGIRGCTCDYITAVISPEENWNKGYRKWINLILSMDQYHPTGISQVQAFFRTTIADKTGYGHGRPEFGDAKEQMQFFDLARGFFILSGSDAVKEHRQNPMIMDKIERWSRKMEKNNHYAVYLQYLLKFVPDEPVVKTDHELLQPFLVSSNQYGHLEWPPEDDEKQSKEEYLRLRHRYGKHSVLAAKQKSFFVTAKGYIGLGPPLLQVEDKLSILFGCEHPLTLRQDGGAYLLIGEAYVYGMMQGEMIAALDEGKLVDQEFVIR